MPQELNFIVGNSYKSITKRFAKTSRSGIRKTHDVEVFLDITNGDPDLIHQVSFHLGSSFDPETFTCTTPVLTTVQCHNNSKIKVWRFSTRQQVFGSFTATIKIRGAGGTGHQVTHSIILNDTHSEADAHSEPDSIFSERKSLRQFLLNKVPPSSKFGIELELTSVNQLDTNYISEQLQDHNNIAIDVIEVYGASRHTSTNWKMVPDGSIVCSTTQPDCNKFELVSPPLTGGQGLRDVNIVLKRMGNIFPRLKVNKSMGFHVHVDTSTFTFPQVRKICQQFVKYESVIDTFMPRSRRTGSTESNSYFQSNHTSIKEELYCGARGRVTNKNILRALEECEDYDQLGAMMNRHGRYHKLNLQNLVTGRQSTIEFRQHSATMSYEKVGAWVRFCIAFCNNSAKLRAPTGFKEGSSMEKMFLGLFSFVIKDRGLRDFYEKRQMKLRDGGEEEDCACCTGCGVGGGGGGTCDSKLH
jgi:hypothetical protein